MPSRPVTVAIFAFWLLTAGWFVTTDVVETWRSGEPLPYTIEMADEAQIDIVPYRWICVLNRYRLGAIRGFLEP